MKGPVQDEALWWMWWRTGGFVLINSIEIFILLPCEWNCFCEEAGKSPPLTPDLLITFTEETSTFGLFSVDSAASGGLMLPSCEGVSHQVLSWIWKMWNSSCCFYSCDSHSVGFLSTDGAFHVFMIVQWRLMLSLSASQPRENEPDLNLSLSKNICWSQLLKCYLFFTASYNRKLFWLTFLNIKCLFLMAAGFMPLMECEQETKVPGCCGF